MISLLLDLFIHPSIKPSLSLSL
ncbi:hypothetical protein CSUI_006781, partial [Cystoisospora suis]